MLAGVDIVRDDDEMIRDVHCDVAHFAGVQCTTEHQEKDDDEAAN